MSILPQLKDPKLSEVVIPENPYTKSSTSTNNLLTYVDIPETLVEIDSALAT